jgi:hypothetical protein
LEAEALLLGMWKNIEELEECLNLPELEKILKASRDKEHEQRKFAAALEGINLDEASESENKERFEAVQRRVAARLSGKSETEIEYDELGIDIEVEE